MEDPHIQAQHEEAGKLLGRIEHLVACIHNDLELCISVASNNPGPLFQKLDRMLGDLEAHKNYIGVQLSLNGPFSGRIHALNERILRTMERAQELKRGGTGHGAGASRKEDAPNFEEKRKPESTEEKLIGVLEKLKLPDLSSTSSTPRSTPVLTRPTAPSGHAALDVSIVITAACALVRSAINARRRVS